MDALSLPKSGQKKPRPRHLKPKFFVSLTSFVILAALFAWYFSPLNFLQAQAANMNSVPGQVPSIVKKSTVVGATDPSTSITVSIGLRLRNADGLDLYIKSISQGKKRTLTQDQLAKAYEPLPSSQTAVITYMQQYGFQTIQTYKNHLLIGFKGTIAQAQQAFHVQINNYRSPDGKAFYAPAADPIIPNALASLVQSITGLDSTLHISRSPIHRVNKQSTTQANTTKPGAAGSCTPDPNIWPSNTYFTAGQIASAYNLTSMHSAGLNGEGQVVGLVEFDNFSDSDIQTYANCYGGSAVPIERVPVPLNSSIAPPGVNASEVDLDMQLILSAAPHLAGLRVYIEANNSSTNPLLMWNQIVSDAVPVVSDSWTFGCEQQIDKGFLQSEHDILAIAVAQGQSIFVASGDTGSTSCTDTNGNLLSTLSVSDPVSQPFVTSVGGTSLTMNNGSYGSEAVWNNAPALGIQAASGGGISSVWPMPSWQQGPGVNNSFSSGTPCGAPSGTFCREVPDVALNADPNNQGFLIFCTVSVVVNNNPVGCTGDFNGWFPIGGTSAAAPMWAAMTALANQKSLQQGDFNLGFLNPLLYQISQNAAQYSNDFHDVTIAGNNNVFGNAEYPTTTAYDMATGLGSYNAANLASDLVNLAASASGPRSTPANTTWYFAEGSVGNSFSEFITVLNPDATKQANVSITYLFQDKNAKTVNHSVPANSRGTFSANDDLGIPASSPNQEAISLIVASDIPIVAERPMYFNFQGVPSGTDVLGATHIDQTTFYFAAGDERQDSTRNYQTFVTILNPSTSQTATVTATYYAQGNVVGTKTIQVGPRKRGTTSPADLNIHQQVAIKVTSNIGIVVERPLYFHDNIATAGGNTTGASSAVGANKLGNDWLFAEGFTGQDFQEFIVLANFTTSATTAHVKLEYLNGQVQDVPVSVPAQSQVFFDVNNANQHPNCTCQVTASHSTDVTDADSAIVAERLMFFHFGPAGLSGGSDAVGEIGPASHSTYSFAEGFTIGNWAEFITLQNPTSSAEQVAVTLYTDHAVVEKLVQLPAFSRTTVDVNPIAVPIAQAYPGAGAFEVSASVQALNGGVVVAERPLYFQFGSLPSDGGSSILGYTGG